jgi:hypothetical protein
MTRGLAMRIAGFALAIAVLWSVAPPEFPLCAFRWITGRPCPFCGLTHAVFALAHGNLAAALRYHALSPLAVLLLAGTFWNARRMARYWTPCLAAFAAYGIFRIALG